MSGGFCGSGDCKGALRFPSFGGLLIATTEYNRSEGSESGGCSGGFCDSGDCKGTFRILGFGLLTTE